VRHRVQKLNSGTKDRHKVRSAALSLREFAPRNLAGCGEAALAIPVSERERIAITNPHSEVRLDAETGAADVEHDPVEYRAGKIEIDRGDAGVITSGG